jgi:hypothetical protein
VGGGGTVSSVRTVQVGAITITVYSWVGYSSMLAFDAYDAFKQGLRMSRVHPSCGLSCKPNGLQEQP